MVSTRIGVNLYGLREELGKDEGATLMALREAGVGAIEPCVFFGDRDALEAHLASKPPARARQLRAVSWPWEDVTHIDRVRELSFDVRSAHLMGGSSTLDQLVAGVPSYVRFVKESGVRYLALSLMRDARDMVAFLPALEEVGSALVEAGAHLLYHNHEAELLPIDGLNALDLIVRDCPSVHLQMDVGWVAFVGEDPVSSMERYANRLDLVHLKDFRRGFNPALREHEVVATGQGALDLPGIVSCAARLGLGEECLIIDQDESSGNILDDIARGVAAVRAAELDAR